MKRWLAASLALLSALPAWAGKKNSLFIDVAEQHEAEERDGEKAFAAVMKKMQRGELPTIQFEFDSDEILPESYDALDAIIHILYADPRLKLMVLAHTCRIGSEKYNLDLSERRAKAVKSYLVKQGIPPPSIRYRGMGFSQPIADNSTEDGRSRNRRVEMRVTKRDWEAVY